MPAIHPEQGCPRLSVSWRCLSQDTGNSPLQSIQLGWTKRGCKATRGSEKQIYSLHAVKQITGSEEIQHIIHNKAQYRGLSAPWAPPASSGPLDKLTLIHLGASTKATLQQAQMCAPPGKSWEFNRAARARPAVLLRRSRAGGSPGETAWSSLNHCGKCVNKWRSSLISDKDHLFKRKD